ncbi:MAG: ATP-binding protein [Elainellaceae cyanobacterium]
MLRFLLLEDDPLDYELIEAALNHGGIEGTLTRVSDCPAFTAALNEPLDLILADYILPKFNGLEALTLAQSICPDVPFILVSGVLGEEQAIEAMQQGATDYVLKQRLQRLVPAVLRSLRESQAQQERQRLEAERRLSEAQLAQQAEALASANERLLQVKLDLENRNRDLRQFAYAISHDLKAPLRGIDNLSAWIAEDYADQLPSEAKHKMGLLRQRVHNMKALIDGLLEFARVGQMNTSLELVDLEALLAEIIYSLAPPENVVIYVQPNLPELWARRLSLRQVFTNLISNAIKHSRGPNVAVTISAQEHNQAYEFIVADNGPGIAPEHHDRIFEIFQTLKVCHSASNLAAGDRGENTGVGLALVKRIIELEGGEIAVESQPGDGATFRFTWPSCSR